MSCLVILMGAPGSGKTTIAQTFSKRRDDFKDISIGEIMRNEMQMTPPFGDFDRLALLDHVIDLYNASNRKSLIIDFNPYPLKTWQVLTEKIFNMFDSIYFFEIVSDNLEDRLRLRNRSDESTSFDYKDRLAYFYNNVYPEIEKISDRIIVKNDNLNSSVDLIISKVCQS